MFFGRLAMAAIFLLAAKEKIADPAAFALAVYRYRIVPSWGVNGFALVLPWVEVFAAVALMAPRRAGLWRAAGGGLIAGMLAMFTVAYGIALMRGISISCGCFNLSPDAVAGGWRSLAQNAVLFAGGAVLFADTFFRTADDEPESA
jgi:hypothetical protein